MGRSPREAMLIPVNPEKARAFEKKRGRGDAQRKNENSDHLKVYVTHKKNKKKKKKKKEEEKKDREILFYLGGGGGRRKRR